MDELGFSARKMTAALAPTKVAVSLQPAQKRNFPKCTESLTLCSAGAKRELRHAMQLLSGECFWDMTWNFHPVIPSPRLR